MAFQKAVKQKLKAKICLDGPSGSGKTFSALRMATGLGGKIALIDTENSSASLYANRFNFDADSLYGPFTPESYVAKIRDAEQSGYDILIIDSISHEWNGPGGCLEIMDKLGGKYQDWAKVTPRHNAFVAAIINSPIHIISTVRSKTGYEMGEKDGKKTVTKMGLQPVTRDGFEYENTICFSLNDNNWARSSKDRTSLFAGRDFQITEDTGREIMEWLNDGEEPVTLADLMAKMGEAKAYKHLANIWNKYRPQIQRWGQADQEAATRAMNECKATFSTQAAA